MNQRNAVMLRRVAPSDGPAIAELFEQTPDAGQIRFTTRFATDAYTALTALHPDSAGVVAVLPTSGRIVGMAMVDFSQRQVEGVVRPCARLNVARCGAAIARTSRCSRPRLDSSKTREPRW